MSKSEIRKKSDGEEATAFEHFVEAQNPVYEQVRRELSIGQKSTHWMWFIFPQLAGLGRSAMSQRYALRSAEEARRYWCHPTLGSRLRECTQLTLNIQHKSAAEIFGSIDALKLRSCMTLFSISAPEEPLFTDVLKKYFGGEPDPLTIQLLKEQDF